MSKKTRAEGDNWQTEFEQAINAANRTDANWPTFHLAIHNKITVWANGIIALQGDVESNGGLAVQGNLGITPEIDQAFNCLATFLTASGIEEADDATPDAPIFLSLGVIYADNAMAIMLGYLLAQAIQKGEVQL